MATDVHIDHVAKVSHVTSDVRNIQRPPKLYLIKKFKKKIGVHEEHHGGKPRNPKGNPASTELWKNCLIM